MKPFKNLKGGPLSTNKRLGDIDNLCKPQGEFWHSSLCLNENEII